MEYRNQNAIGNIIGGVIAVVVAVSLVDTVAETADTVNDTALGTAGAALVPLIGLVFVAGVVVLAYSIFMGR